MVMANNMVEENVVLVLHVMFEAGGCSPHGKEDTYSLVVLAIFLWGTFMQVPGLPRRYILFVRPVLVRAQLSKCLEIVREIHILFQRQRCQEQGRPIGTGIRQRERRARGQDVEDEADEDENPARRRRLNLEADAADGPATTAASPEAWQQ